MNAPGLYIQYLIDILLQHISWKLFDAGIDGAFEFCCACQKEIKCNQLISSCGGILPIYPGAPILTLLQAGDCNVGLFPVRAAKSGQSKVTSQNLPS